MILQSNKLNDYLKMTPVIDWGDWRIQEKTAEIVYGAATDIDKGRKLFEWVRDRIPHSADIGSEVVTCSASEVLEGGTGICYAKSHLLAAMCRFAGIPTGFCYQIYRCSPHHCDTAIHAFNAVHLASIGKWIRIDARGNTGDIDAQFGIEREQLAFPVDPEKGELFIYNMVFTDPVPEVVEVLSRYESRSEMWRNLPAAIHDELLCPEDRALNATLKSL